MSPSLRYRRGGSSARRELSWVSVSVPRPNSFHFVPVRDVPRGAGGGCPLVAEPAAERSGRQLWLRLRDRMRLCETRTRDFDDAEIARVKATQLYLDGSKKLAPDDFRRDLVKLSLDPDCVGCPRFAGCGHCFAGKSGDVFSRDDARLREIVRELSGAVLDVGAGEGPYAAELDRERVQLVAVEPDAERARVLASRMPRARVVADLHHVDGRFDHVLVIRSANHLPDPEAAFARLAELLSPGGTLVVADDEAFALVRTEEQARRAEQGPAEFEHYRNDSAEQMHARLATLSLRLLERRDVTPESSTLWLLRYQKEGA